jgi:hypothetical protein
LAVRREAVRLELEDDFSRKALQAAVAARALAESVDEIGSNSIAVSKSTRTTSRDFDSLSTSAVRGSSSIDKLSGRLGILLKVAATLGPALIPLGAVGVAGVAGLANQFGFAAIAAGTAVIAFQGVGDALKAVNEAALEPTVANLEKARFALDALSPAGQALVGQLQEMRPLLIGLRDSAAGAFFPGLIDGLETLERLAPSLDAILTSVGSTLGDLFEAGAESLTSDRWADFFAVLAMNARPVLTDMASALGDVVHGLSELWEAFMPLNRDFGSWIADAARGFDDWATGLSQTEGFEEFIAYIRENGPKVADATVAIANAVLQIVEAAAPLGGPVLQAITSFAEAVATIADSPLGTPIMAAVTAMSALSLATNVATAATLRLKAAQATLGVGAKGAPASGAVVGGGLAAGLSLIGLMDTAPDYIQNLEMMANGERGVVEGLARMAAGANPVGAALNLLGVDILGVDDDGQKFLGTLADNIQKQRELADATNVTRDESRRFRNTFLDTNLQLLRTARETERVKAALKEQREAVHAAGEEWGDYSAKVQLGKTSMDDLIRRWDRIAEASRDFGTNIRDALQRGLDPKIINDVIKTLGPRGAAGALEDFANASGSEAERIEGSFRRMSRGVRGTESAIDAVKGLLRGDGLSLDPSGIVNGAKKGEQSIKDLADGVSGAILGLHTLDRQKPNPTADLDISGVQTGVASAERLLTGLNGNTAHTYVITHLRTVRDPGDTAGGPPALNDTGADGATVPKTGRPYADRHPYLLADGEEVISNRYGQADRHRALLKAINANRYANGGTIRSERPMSTAGSGGRSTVVVRDRFPSNVRLVIEGRSFNAHIEGIATDAAESAIEGYELMSAEEQRAG